MPRKCFGQRQHILPAFAQRWYLKGNNVEPVEQVLAEVMRPDLGLQVAVGGGDDPGVNLDGLVAADALERLLLHEAQKLGLQGRGHVGDFVEEDGTAMRRLQASGFVLESAREGTTHVSEQFAFQQVLRERGAVDDDEGPCLRWLQ